MQFADLDSAAATLSPAHFAVAHVVVRLPRPLEQQDWSLKAGLQEVSAGPIGSTPLSVHRVCLLPVAEQQALAESFHNRNLFRQQKPAEELKSLAVIVDRPQGADLRVLQHPSVEDCEEADLLALGFQLQNHFLRDKSPFAHSPKTIGPVRLYRPHRSDVFLSESL